MNLLDQDGAAISDTIWIKAGLTQGGWRRESVKIPAESIGSSIIIEFLFFSDDFQPNDVELDGWYIDDVTIIPE